MHCNLDLLLQADDSKKVTLSAANTLEQIIDEQMVLKTLKSARTEVERKEVSFFKRTEVKRSIKSVATILCVMSILMIWFLKATQVRNIVVYYIDNNIIIQK